MTPSIVTSTPGHGFQQLQNGHQETAHANTPKGIRHGSRQRIRDIPRPQRGIPETTKPPGSDRPGRGTVHGIGNDLMGPIQRQYQKENGENIGRMGIAHIAGLVEIGLGGIQL